MSEDIVEIALKCGNTLVIDKDDWPLIKRYSWRSSLNKKKTSSNRYVRGYAHDPITGLRREIAIHRFLLKAPKETLVDHINGNGLDNRRSNLRLCSAEGNARNTRKLADSRSSSYKGVHRRPNGRFHASILDETTRKSRHIGAYESEAVAAISYDMKALDTFGEFAKTNFPRELVLFVKALSEAEK